MKGKKFKKLKLFTLIFNLILFGGLFLVIILCLINKEVGSFFFSTMPMPDTIVSLLQLVNKTYTTRETNLFFTIWIVAVIPMLLINFYYFEEKNKYEISTGKYEQNEQLRALRRRKLFKFFIFLNILCLSLLTLSVYSLFKQTVIEPYSAEVFTLSTLALVVGIVGAIGTKK